MKKIISILSLVAITFMFVSCDKVEADKDVEKCILKLNQFNEKFAELYADNVISRDTVSGKELSEYDELEKIATEYYELMNKINSQIKDEKEKAEKGKKTKGYEEAYNKALEDNKEEIEKSTTLFEQNIAKIDVIEDEEIEEPIVEEPINENLEVIETSEETITE